ncbi:MAG: hypothetical protein AAB774_02515 [Patescibacteria group bacterium]
MITSKKKEIKSRPKHHQAEREIEKELRISFSSKEFPHHAKNELWYIGIGLLLVVGLFASISVKNYLFALVVAAAGIAIFRLTHLQPESKIVEISPRGLVWGGTFWGYHQLKNFWIAEIDGNIMVYLERLNFAPIIHFEVPDDKIEDVLEALSFELPFHEHKDEPIPDRFARLLRI